MAGETAVNPASAGRDCFSALAPELLHMIIAYLLVDHRPDRAFENVQGVRIEMKKGSHNLDYLAATCRSLRNAVMDFAEHFLIQNCSLTGYKPLKTTQLQNQRDFLRGRGGLLNWLENHCAFCGKISCRIAILMSSLRCCVKCDQEQWPGKINKTSARDQFDLKDFHILPHKTAPPKNYELPPGLPRLRYGTYMSCDTPTTMFIRNDVERLAMIVHGDLEAHLAKRDEKRRQRIAKLKKSRELRASPLLRELYDLMG